MHNKPIFWLSRWSQYNTHIRICGQKIPKIGTDDNGAIDVFNFDKQIRESESDLSLNTTIDFFSTNLA